MNEPSKYLPESLDPQKEAALLIRRFGPTGEVRNRLIAELGFSETDADEYITSHKDARRLVRRGYILDRLALVAAALLLGLIAGLFLVLSAPKAAISGTLPFIFLFWIGAWMSMRHRRNR